MLVISQAPKPLAPQLRVVLYARLHNEVWMSQSGEDTQQTLNHQPDMTDGPDEPIQSVGAPRTIRPVPWTLRQTIAGLLLTLVPWLIISIGASLLSPATSSSSPVHVSRSLDIATGVVVFIISALLEGIFLIAPLIIVSRQPIPDATWRERLSWLGLRRTALEPAALIVLVGAALGIGGSALYSWLISFLKLPIQNNTEALVRQAQSAPFTTLGLLVASVVVAPICEEIFFRGFAFVGLLKGMSLVPAMLVSAAIFAIAHTDIGSLVPLFIIGVALAWARWRSDSLWPGVIIHTLNNLLALLTLWPYLFK
jgi:membrane protease YdiL (CAAX protease family)